MLTGPSQTDQSREKYRTTNNIASRVTLDTEYDFDGYER